MPLFEDVARDSNSYTMWLFWPLTIVLTVIVFIAWHLWVRHSYKPVREKATKSII